MEILELTRLSSAYVIEKGKGKFYDDHLHAISKLCSFTAIIEQNYAAHQPLSHMQKDLRLGLSLSEQIEQAMPITAATNEVFKGAKRSGYAEHDVSAVYVRSRF